jgi:hypothetical protein
MDQGSYEDPGTPDGNEAAYDSGDEAGRGERSEQFDAFDSGDPADGDGDLNPYDTTWSPPDRQPHNTRYGTTLAEERAGESLADKLAEEEPDVYATLEETGGSPADSRAETNGDVQAALEVDAEDPAIRAELAANGGDCDFPAAGYAEQDSRAGRLVQLDEGAHPDKESEMVAYDAGIAGAGASAEEAAIHVVEEDRAFPE